MVGCVLPMRAHRMGIHRTNALAASGWNKEPDMPKTSRLYRLLRLIVAMRAGFRTPDELAAELQVSVRTVYRDLNMLELAGVPYSFDSERGGYEIRKSWFLPSVNLTLEEGLSLVLAAQTAPHSPFEHHVHAGMMKVRSVLPASIQDEVSDLTPRIGRRSGPRGIMNRSFYEQWCRAVRVNAVVHIEYESIWDGGRIQTRVHPYTIYFHRYSWYVIGFSETHHRVRSFKMARILQMTITDVPYQIPDGFSLEKELGNAWGIMKGDTDHHVRIRFSAKVAPHIRETLWHPTQRVTPLPDKGCLFEATVAGTTEILSWILSWGEHAVVEQPEILKKRVLQVLSAQREHYAL